jgi:hypothetical protein
MVSIRVEKMMLWMNWRQFFDRIWDVTQRCKWDLFASYSLRKHSMDFRYLFVLLFKIFVKILSNLFYH